MEERFKRLPLQNQQQKDGAGNVKPRGRLRRHCLLLVVIVVSLVVVIVPLIVVVALIVVIFIARQAGELQ